MELIDKENFDFLGIFSLQEVKGIENLVEASLEGYLSRNRDYYARKTVMECSKERERCSQLLPLQGKKAFVVAERILHCSCRVFYNEYLSLLKSKRQNENEKFDIIKRCLEEDSQRLINALENKKIQPTNIRLPKSKRLTENRFIEAGNKWILYDTVKHFPKIKHVVNPLYGGILIGPFFKIIKGINYTPVLFGMHDQKSERFVKNGIVKEINKIILKKDLANLPKEISVIDDNVGTERTLEILKRTFSLLGEDVKIGGVEMSWTYYDQVKTGIRSSEIFNIKSIDFPTFRDTRHHKITERLVKALCRNGNEYLRELKLLGFHNQFISDDTLLFNRGKSIAYQYNQKFSSYLNKTSNFILSMDLMNKKVRYLEKESFDKALNIVRDYETVNVIDIDRHQGRKPNLDIIKRILKIKRCRIGGGVKTRRDIQQLLDMGAQKVIIGTHAREELFQSFPKNKIVIAIDSVDRKTGKKKNVTRLIKRFENYCNEFQYVCVETDGKMQGGDIENAIKYSKLTKNKFNCVGGISSKQEMIKLKQYNIGCVVGRALLNGYFG